ncbi:hypothetical protein JRQ81_004364 [Phrynocephalus forsythii]|uniref:Ig-like domain-containing protein n=1 Tax=Phrynocephalus forsythii TaxID=171643 RepID=A0A9Q1AUJ2_9SAUR|nr:hypothetical protein JRQ81_004364 [Phrynocephalus forsythii]
MKFLSRASHFLVNLGSFFLLFNSDFGAGDSVSQWPSILSVPEGKDVDLYCSFSTVDPNPYLYWYRQFPSQPPKHVTTFTKYSKNVSGTMDFDKKRVNLKIEKASLQDEAVYFCALRTTVMHRKMFHNWTSFVFIMTVLSSLGSAQKVDQPESATAFAGTSYELLCNLSSVSTEYIQWYRQFPGRGPQYIASVYPGNTGEGTHPKSTLRAAKDKKSSVLVLHHVTLADAATYFCALSDAQCVRAEGMMGSLVSQTEDTKTVTQGEELSINCTYDKTIYTLFWYIQRPGQSPKLFLRDTADPSDEGHIQGFGAKNEKHLRTFYLKKTASQLEDSAVYFCAGSDTVRRASGEVNQKHSEQERHNTEETQT